MTLLIMLGCFTYPGGLMSLCVNGQQSGVNGGNLIPTMHVVNVGVLKTRA